jgi:hypothetical protein
MQNLITLNYHVKGFFYQIVGNLNKQSNFL